MKSAFRGTKPGALPWRLAVTAGLLATFAGIAHSRDAAPPEPAVRVSIEPERPRVGDLIRLEARIEAPEGTRAALPSELHQDEKLGAFRVVSAEASGAAVTLTLSPEDTGSLEIPSFRIPFRAPDGAEGTATVPARRIAVASILGDGDSSALADLKPPADFQVPLPWKEILLAGAAMAAFTAGIVWLVRRLRRPRGAPVRPEETLAPGMTPDLWGRQELAKLLARQLVEEGRLREFHIELADLVRRYVELRFRIPALERTTEEIQDEIERSLVGPEVAATAWEALTRCDRVKFAQHAPERTEIDGSIDLVRGLLERTSVASPEARSAVAAAPAPEGAV